MFAIISGRSWLVSAPAIVPEVQPIKGITISPAIYDAVIFATVIQNKYLKSASAFVHSYYDMAVRHEQLPVRSEALSV